MQAIGLERSIWINAPRERVWKAVADFNEVVQWFLPNLPGAQFQRDEHNKIAIQLGPMSIDFLVLEALNAPEKITLRNLPDKQITTSYILSEDNNGTNVTVKVSGFESLNESAQEDRLQLSGAGWEKALQNLKAFVNTQDLPFPQAFVGPLFGYWRESKNTLASERSIWIDAPSAKVWDAITDPKQIQLWFSPTTPWELSALEVGGRFYVHDAETNAEMYTEIIELINPLYQLVTRTLPEEGSKVVKGKTYTLKEENGGTRLTVTLSGYEQDAEENRWNTLEQNTFGFGTMLQNAKAYLEGESLPFPFGF